MHAVAYRAHTHSRALITRQWNTDAYNSRADDFRSNEQTTLNLQTHLLSYGIAHIR